MKNLLKNISLAATTILLLAAPLYAQSAAQTEKPKAKSTLTPRDASTGMASGREAQTGQASGVHAAANPSTQTNTSYKDPEDMTTRTRPANGGNSGSSATVDAKAKQSVLPACDGASKDAAKCTAASTGSRSNTRVNKVDSFTVKQ